MIPHLVTKKDDPHSPANHDNIMNPCPLCFAEKAVPFFQDPNRDYFHCPTCSLTFVPPEYFLSTEEEKARYDTHENNPDDPAYRKFLSRVFDPLHLLLAPGSCGLDFGSGPGPTLSVMFEEQGHSMTLFDTFYAPHPTALQQTYDFITATEVLEHLHHSGTDLNRLWGCLKPGGYLGIMTRLAPSGEHFADWFYKKDPTHVSFFSASTFEWLSSQWQASLRIIGDDVIILRKPCKL